MGNKFLRLAVLCVGSCVLGGAIFFGCLTVPFMREHVSAFGLIGMVVQLGLVSSCLTAGRVSA